MKRLIKFELYKMLRQKSTYICTAVAALLAIVGIVTVYAVYRIIGVDDHINYSGLYFLRTNLGSTNIAIFMSIFSAILICSEYSGGTIKNIISKGFSRIQFFIAKSVTSYIGMFIMIGANYLVSFLVGTIVFGLGKADDNMFLAITAQIVYCIAYMTFFNFIAFFFKKTGAAIALGIVFPVVESITVASIDTFANLKFKLADLMIDTQLTYACDISTDAKKLCITMLVSLLYFVTFLIAGRYCVKKTEI